jgi:hypothetical protein
MESWKSGRLRLAKGEITQGQFWGKVAADYALLYAIPTLYMTVAKSLLTSGDDKDSLLKKTYTDQISAPVSSLPVLRELVPAMQGRDYTGPAGFRIFSSSAKAFGKAAEGKFPGRELNQIGGIVFQYPSLQLQRIADGIEAISDGTTANPLAPVFGARNAK